ncbi:MAG: 3-phosphoshikimate 1-carboxyvinyltransferase, partial [Pyrinomonadaceae bacterium]
VIERDGSTVIIDGAGDRGLREAEGALDAGNSGTTIRLLSGILAWQSFSTTLIGDKSLCRRPMRRIAEPLNRMGARVETQANGCAPLIINGRAITEPDFALNNGKRRRLHPIEYRLPVASAQIKSTILLAALGAEGVTTVIEPTPTRDHTERMLRGFGANITGNITMNGNKISLTGGATLYGREFIVPGDLSSAAFFVAAATILPDSELVIKDVGLNPTRSSSLEAFKQLGANISIQDMREECGEPVGTLRVKSSNRNEERRVKLSGRIIPNLIDELPLLGFTAGALGCELEVQGAAELRVKESDRIASTVENLRRLGVKSEAREDGFIVHRGNGQLKGALLDSFKDHRMAMGCAIAALAAEGACEIKDADEAVKVSLPEFWALLESISE